MGQNLSSSRSQSSRGSTIETNSVIGWKQQNTTTQLPTNACKVFKNLLELYTAVEAVNKAPGALQKGNFLVLGKISYKIEEIITYHKRVIALILIQINTENITIVCSHAKSNGDLFRVFKQGVFTVGYTNYSNPINVHKSVWKFLIRYIWPQVFLFITSKIAQSKKKLFVNFLGMSMGGMFLQLLVFKLTETFTPQELLVSSPVLMLAVPRVANLYFYEYMKQKNVDFINVSSSQEQLQNLQNSTYSPLNVTVNLTLDPVVTLGSNKKFVSSPVYVLVHNISNRIGIYKVDPKVLHRKQTTLLFLLKYKHLHSRRIYEKSVNAILKNNNMLQTCAL
jgi:hypothetical protein